MPELPEIETTRLGISSHIQGKTIHSVCIRQHKLRWPIPEDFAATVCEQTIIQVVRRAKYLIVELQTGIILIHLGMSGSLRFLTRYAEPKKHDHVDIAFTDGSLIRYHDPRRFGAILWFAGIAEHHPLLSKLGCEPLSTDFNSKYFFLQLQKQSRAIKLALMDNANVVGVGNIYANESLFRARISPFRAANTLTKTECTRLVSVIKEVLSQAIAMGGSTLRDFVDSDGKAGYFQQTYTVYGRASHPCLVCGTLIEQQKLGQRASFYCPVCQK